LEVEYSPGEYERLQRVLDRKRRTEKIQTRFCNMMDALRDEGVGLKEIALAIGMHPWKIYQLDGRKHKCKSPISKGS